MVEFLAPDGRAFDSKIALEEYLLANGFLEFSGESGCVLVKSAGEINGESFSLNGLSNCTVVLMDVMGQLTVDRLVNCQVFAAPCSGSCFLRRCEGCSFTLACKQFRAWQCWDCEFFLNIATDPVIEESQNVYFGRFNSNLHPELDELMLSNSFRTQEEGKWRCVFDFSGQDGNVGNWTVIEPTQPLLDVKKRGISPLGTHLLRHIFWKFDQDRDGGLSYRELNIYQASVGSEERVESAEELISFCSSADISLDENGNLPFWSFIKLYELNGEDNFKSDILKLEISDRSVIMFPLHLYQTLEEEYSGFDDSSDEEVLQEKQSQKFDAKQCALHLCNAAQSRGIDVLKWFNNYDPKKIGSLEKSAFERGFSAMLIGLCACDSETYVADVEIILHPSHFDSLCASLASPDGRVSYMPLAVKDKTHSQPATPLRASSRLKIEETEVSVEQFVSDEMADKPSEYFDRVRVAINSWKGSVTGITPIRDDHFDMAEFISAANVRLAFRATMKVNFRMSQIHTFLDMLEEQVETEMERKLRKRDGGHRIVCIASLLRWLSSTRRSKTISRDAWLCDKQLHVKKTKEKFESNLQAALRGSIPEMEQVLAHPKLLKLHLQVPQRALESEAEFKVRDFIDSAVGQSAIRKRIARLQGKGEMNPATVAKDQLIQEMVQEQLNSSLEIKLLKQYCRGKQLGSISCDFDRWLQQKDDDHRRKLDSIKKWERKHQRIKSGDVIWCLAKDVIDRIKSMVNRTYTQQQEDGYIVNRSSRNLDAEHHVALMLRWKVESEGKQPSADRLALIHSGAFLISHKQVVDHFSDLLLSLSADPKVGQSALELLDPGAMAQKQLEEMLGTKLGQDKLFNRTKSLMEKGSTKSQANDMAKDYFRGEFEKSILEKLGFRKATDDSIVDNLLEERKRKTESDFKKWTKRKAKEKRAEERAVKQLQQAKASEALQRKKESKKEFVKWKKAVSKKKYYSLADGETPQKKILRPRNPVSPNLQQPSWVFEVPKT